MKLHHLAAAAVLAAGLLTDAAAQAAKAPASAPAALPTSPAKKALAARVIELQKPAIEGMARDMARETTQRVMNVAAQAMTQVPADKREALGKEVQADLKAFHTDAEAKLGESATKTAPATLATFLEEKFTEPELKQIAAWLESPVSKKYQQLGGEMQLTLQRKLVDDSKTVVDAKLKVLEASLQKRFAPYLPAPASAPASAPAAPRGK